MKKLLIPAMMLMAAVAAPAMAQDTLTSRGDVELKKPTFESLMTAMTNAKTTNDELLKRTTISDADLVIVDAKPLLEGKGEDMLKVQFERSKGDIKQLQEILGKHPAIAERLKKESATPELDDIIAAELLPNNKVQLYYKDM